MPIAPFTFYLILSYLKLGYLFTYFSTQTQKKMTVAFYTFTLLKYDVRSLSEYTHIKA